VELRYFGNGDTGGGSRTRSPFRGNYEKEFKEEERKPRNRAPSPNNLPLSHQSPTLPPRPYSPHFPSLPPPPSLQTTPSLIHSPPDTIYFPHPSLFGHHVFFNCWKDFDIRNTIARSVAPRLTPRIGGCRPASSKASVMKTHGHRLMIHRPSGDERRLQPTERTPRKTQTRSSARRAQWAAGQCIERAAARAWCGCVA